MKNTCGQRVLYFASLLFGMAASLQAETVAGSSGAFLVEISTRGYVGPGVDAVIAGYIVQTDQPKNLVVRGLGPSLPFAHTLQDPYLALYQAPPGGAFGYNDDWADTQRIELVADGLAPEEEDEAAVAAAFPAGAYTAVLYGEGADVGTGLVEVYDLAAAPDSRLVNISTRAVVQAEPNVLIAGFIVAGEGSLPVLLRALGPSLSDVIPGTLSDPTLELHDAEGTLLAFNDNWRGDQAAEIIATTIPPEQEAESAIVASLSPGPYTAIVRGSGQQTGLALVEVYALD